MRYFPSGIFWLAVVFPLFSYPAAAQNQNQAVYKTAVQAPIPQPRNDSAAIEQAVLNEINAARKNPEIYVGYLQEYRKLFKGNTVYFPDFLRIETNEGTAAVDEAIGELKKILPLNALASSADLSKTANLQLGDLRENSSLGHTGKNGSNLTQRLKQFGMAGAGYAENIAYYADTARDIVLLMIVDDGVKSRAHRKTLFSPNFKIVGIAYGKGKTGEGLCVADFADSFFENGQKSGIRQF